MQAKKQQSDHERTLKNLMRVCETVFMNLRKPTHLPVQPHSKGFEEDDVAPSIGLGS